jgi:hypothetical protein
LDVIEMFSSKVEDEKRQREEDKNSIHSGNSSDIVCHEKLISKVFPFIGLDVGCEVQKRMILFSIDDNRNENREKGGKLNRSSFPRFSILIQYM